jgi:FKBP-type peptidyl-prolyl cis-trans isomerase
MKKFTSFILLSLTTLCLYTQQPAKKPVSAAQKPAEVKLKTAVDSNQYILGAYLGQYIRSNGFSITNVDFFIKGMNDGIANKNMMVDAQTISKKMGEYQGQLSMERSVALEKQLFEAIKGRPGFGVLPSGVCYAIIKTGAGPRPLLTDSVQLQVKGYLPDGKLFEDTYAKKNPYKITPAGLIPGLSEVVQIMPEGSLWKVFIPSALAFGAKGVQGAVPAYSAVIFEVELIKVK